MSEENNKLAKPIGSLFKAKKVGVAAKLDAAREPLDPQKATHRIGIIFDDSGSMGSKDRADSPLQQAKQAFSEFTKVCNPHDTAIAVSFMTKEGNTDKPLTTDLILLDMYIQGIDAPNGTPLWTTMDRLINKESISRAVIFSDGSPTDGNIGEPGYSYSYGHQYNPEDVVKQYKEKGIVADTVFIGSESDATGIRTMKWIAEQTGGVFLHFTEPGLFAKNFKYLAPAFRYMLADKSFQEEITKK